MSDFSEGWIVWGTTRPALLSALAKEQASAFVSRGRAPFRVFPREGRAVERRLSAHLGAATLLAFAAGDDAGEARLVAEGRVLARVATSGRLATAAQLASATKLVRVALSRLRRSLGSGALRIADPMPHTVVEALGVDYDAVAYRWYAQLTAERLDVDPREVPELSYVDSDGAEHAFALAFRPVTVPRRRTTMAAPVDRTPEALFDEMRRLDPRRAKPEARALLERLVEAGPTATASAPKSLALRETAAMLLGRCLEALPAEAQREQAERIANAVRTARDATTRATWVMALRRVGHLVRAPLEACLAEEREPTVARRAFEALNRIEHEPPDAELFALISSECALDRKGAYALLEQSASPRTLGLLVRRLDVEGDESARALLAVVVERLRSDADD